MPNTIKTLEWKNSRKALVAEVAKLSDGELRIIPTGGGYDLWFYRSGDWGTNNFLGHFITPILAKAHATEWVGDSDE